ncbi:hypothetical protein SVIOM342S_06107 [Streptomyces violaceorubidus]
MHDPDPSPPADLTRPDVEPPDPWREGGRGLLLIRALSSSCGHRPTEAGKAVWFRLPRWYPLSVVHRREPRGRGPGQAGVPRRP